MQNGINWNRNVAVSVKCMYRVLMGVALSGVLGIFPGAASWAGEGGAETSARMDVLTPAEWERVDGANARALHYLAQAQQPDGSFPTLVSGQPGVTALCAMAFLANGHTPGTGPQGKLLERAVDFVLSTQRPDGMFCLDEINPYYQVYVGFHTGNYNHMIAGILLCEVYGSLSDEKAERVRGAIERALLVCREQQIAEKYEPAQEGGWRYVQPNELKDSDLSLTAWAIKFLRAAKNAGFDVPEQQIDEAMAYVDRCFDPQRMTFMYGVSGRDRRVTRAMAGAGALTLSLAGHHATPEAQAAGDWIAQQSFEPYNTSSYYYDQYHYSVYYCSQAMFQLGGKHWQTFYPQIVRIMLANQNADGSWSPEANLREDGRYGNHYTTALSVLALSAPNQLLPIYQR